MKIRSRIALTFVSTLMFACGGGSGNNSPQTALDPVTLDTFNNRIFVSLPNFAGTDYAYIGYESGKADFYGIKTPTAPTYSFYDWGLNGTVQSNTYTGNSPLFYDVQNIDNSKYELTEVDSAGAFVLNDQGDPKVFPELRNLPLTIADLNGKTLTLTNPTSDGCTDLTISITGNTANFSEVCDGATETGSGTIVKHTVIEDALVIADTITIVLISGNTTNGTYLILIDDNEDDVYEIIFRQET